MLICGARTPDDCTAEAVQHVQLHPVEEEAGRSPELVLCDAHLDELEPEYRRDWHAIGRWCANPWRKWDYVAGCCVEDQDDNSTKSFTLEQLMWHLDNDPSLKPDNDP
jgi:hypothetical protein